MEEYDRIQMRQSRFNGAVAARAGMSALLQFITTYMPVCRAFG
jgi:hypothetical protein